MMADVTEVNYKGLSFKVGGYVSFREYLKWKEGVIDHISHDGGLCCLSDQSYHPLLWLNDTLIEANPNGSREMSKKGG